MLAGQIVEKGKVDLIEIPEPSLTEVTGAGEIIFQPELACLCGSDIPYFMEVGFPLPLPPGFSLHEMIGIVIDTNGEKFKKGDRVLAVPLAQQGFFERYRVSENRAILLDPRCSPEEALMVQPLGTILSGLRKMPELIGLNVVVIGQGPIGQLFCAALKNLGAAKIIALDRIDSRLSVSLKMGATHTINVDQEDPVARVAELTSNVMADLVVEAVGHSDQQINLSIDLAKPFGHILYFGVPDQTIDGVEWFKFMLKNLTIHGTLNPDFDLDFPLAMDWMAKKMIDINPLITHRYPLAECQKAFEHYRDRNDGSLKVLLDFPK